MKPDGTVFTVNEGVEVMRGVEAGVRRDRVVHLDRERRLEREGNRLDAGSVGDALQDERDLVDLRDGSGAVLQHDSAVSNESRVEALALKVTRCLVEEAGNMGRVVVESDGVTGRVGDEVGQFFAAVRGGDVRHDCGGEDLTGGATFEREGS